MSFTNQEVDEAVGLYQDARAAYQIGDVQLAMSLLESALDIYPPFDRARVLNIEILSNSGSIEQAREELALLSRPYRRGTAGQEIIAYVHAAAGEYEQSLEIYRSINDGSRVEIIYNIARIQLILGEIPQAVTTLEQSLVVRPGFVPAAVLLARLKYDKGMYTESVLLLEDLQLEPGQQYSALLTLASSYYALELFPEFITIVERIRTQNEVVPILEARQLSGYHRLLVQQARTLALIALDDQRALEAYTHIQVLEILSAQQWMEEKDRLQEYPSLIKTREFIETVQTDSL